MAKYTELVSNILKHVGGKENINSTYHCMTRLRFQLKNKGLVEKELLEKVPGVLGVMDAPQDYQVIIGPQVVDVYKEVIAQTGLTELAAIDENLDAKKEPLTFKSVFNKIIAAFSAVFSPLIPVFMIIGTANAIAALIGPVFFKLVAADSDIYNNFYQLGQAVLFLMPVLCAVTAAKHFKVNPYISVVLAGLLVYPGITSLLSAEGGYTVYGIVAKAANYSGQSLPVIVIVWLQSYVEKFVTKVIPDALKVIGIPALTVLILMPVLLCLVGPASVWAGTLLGNALLKLYDVAGPLVTTFMAATSPFGLALGLTRPIFQIMRSIFFQTGVEYIMMPFGMVITNFVTMGLAVGYAIKSKDKTKKQIGITGFVANSIGGVSEPILFGILMPNKKLYLPVLLGGGAAGLLAGLLKLGYYQFGSSNFLSVLGFISEANPRNFTNGCICAAVAFLVTMLATIVMYKEDEKEG